jgi:D-inositol-3-phosphate glycosyltransferase
VVAAAVGGLLTAVRDGVSGVLVDGHHPRDWARVIGLLLTAPGHRAALARGAVAHASQFSWDRTAAGLLAVYRDVMAAHRARLAAVDRIVVGGTDLVEAGSW